MNGNSPSLTAVANVQKLLHCITALHLKQLSKKQYWTQSAKKELIWRILAMMHTYFFWRIDGDMHEVLSQFGTYPIYIFHVWKFTINNNHKVSQIKVTNPQFELFFKMSWGRHEGLTWLSNTDPLSYMK